MSTVAAKPSSLGKRGIAPGNLDLAATSIPSSGIDIWFGEDTVNDYVSARSAANCPTKTGLPGPSCISAVNSALENHDNQVQERIVFALPLLWILGIEVSCKCF